MSLSVGIKKYLVQLSIVFAVFSFGLFTIFADTHKVIASDNNFTDGITVDSKLDTPDANVGNNICDDGSGNCTLRAAIEESNATTGTQTITFNISGTADFTNGGQNGYTIQPTSGLPQITDTVNIDAYTQPGAQANTAIAPNPLNGRLLVELDGNLTSSDTFSVVAGGSNSSFKGFIIGGFSGSVFNLTGCSNVNILGNYLGTKPDGITANRNGADNANSSVVISVGDWSQIPNTDFSTTGTRIGSTNPADRNVLSGNYGGAIGIIGTNTTVLGNYIGVGSDGVTPLGNAQGTGVTTGGMTIDYAHSVTVGGDATGSANVISSNKNGGIQPDYSSDINVIGNYIGTDYTGSQDRGNGGNGVSFAQVDVSGTVGQYTSTVRNNVAKFNNYSGISTNDHQMDNFNISNNTVSDSQTNINITSTGGTITVSNNMITASSTNGIYIGNGSTNNTITGNTISSSTQSGINVSASDNTISSNTISSSGQDGIYLNSGATGNTISSNTVSTSTQSGINVSASDNIISNNTISSSTQSGISVNAINSIIAGNTVINNTIYGISVETSDNTILDNLISNNHGPANIYFGGTGAPISNLTIQGNKIGTKADGTIDNSYTQNVGILLVGDVSNLLIGGSSAGDGNIIAGNNGAGIANSGMDISGFGVSPNKLAIMGNSIYSNNSGSIYGFAMPGLGIDNYTVNLDGSFVPQSTTEEGVTPNDSNDTDTGPNNYMNFPVLQSATQTNDTLALTYDLDAADSPTNQYRVEFFANDVADPSGNGEGQTYLGSVTATNGTGNTANLTLPSGTNLTGKVLSATTTAIDSSTPSGFGSTSEFGEIAPITVLSTTTPNNLADTGDNLWLWLTGAVSLIGVGVYMMRVVGRRG